MGNKAGRDGVGPARTLDMVVAELKLHPEEQVALQSALERAKAESWAQFAVTQAADHAFYAYTLLYDVALKPEALELAVALHTFLILRGVEAPSTNELRTQVQLPVLRIAGPVDPVDFEGAFPLIQQLIAFNRRLITIQTMERRKIGFGFANFWGHTAEEDVFNQQMTVEPRVYTPAEIVAHQTRVISEHDDFAAHLMDPPSPFSPSDPVDAKVQYDLVQLSQAEAKALYDTAVDPGDLSQMQILAKLLRGIQVHQLLGTVLHVLKPPNVLPDSLILHVAREGARAEQQIQQLMAEMTDAVPVVDVFPAGAVRRRLSLRNA